MIDRRIVAALVAVLVFGLACGGLPIGAEEVALEGERPPESPFTWALIMSWTALGLGGGSAVLGIWVDRDRARPIIFAMALSVLILTAICVGGLQGYLDEEGAIETRADLERMLDMVEVIAAESGDPALTALVDANSKRRRPRPGAEGGRGGRGRKADGGDPAEAVPGEAAPTDGAAPTEGAVPAEGEGAAPTDGTAPADGVGTAPTDGAAPTEAAAAAPAEGTAPADPEGKTGKGGKATAKAGGE
jgi:hypothetical protein